MSGLERTPPGTEPGLCHPRMWSSSDPDCPASCMVLPKAPVSGPRVLLGETRAIVATSQEWGPLGHLCLCPLTAGASCLPKPSVARVVRLPSYVCFLHSNCRQNHSKPSHGGVETWSGSAAPPHAPNPKLGATEQGKILPSGEREWGPGVGSSGGGPEAAWASRWDWEG